MMEKDRENCGRAEETSYLWLGKDFLFEKDVIC